jgi:death-on-curing protein
VPEPTWLDLDTIVEIHRKSLARYGGSPGVRDLGLLESALARPQYRYEFEPESDLHCLAAAYAFGLAKNHPFVDGNKRLGFISAYVFLRFNGWHITATQKEAVTSMLALADGSIEEADFARWLRERSERIAAPPAV